MSTQTLFKLDANEISARLPYEHFTNGNLELALSDLSNLLADGDPNKRGVLERSLTVIFDSNHFKSDPLVILCNIRRWAIEGLQDQEFFVNLQGGNGNEDWKSQDGRQSMKTMSRSLTAKQARDVLANAFLGNCNDVMAPKKDRYNCGGLDFKEMLMYGIHRSWNFMSNNSTPRDVGLYKMECILIYFDTCGTLEGLENDRRVISFDLIQFIPLSAEMFPEIGKTEHVGDGLRVHTCTMESTPRKTSAFVNFANPNYGYGKFISSCTQEEILLVCCPELAVGMLFIGKLKDNEVVNVRGVRRFCKYLGYLDSFKCEGPMPMTYEDDMFTVLTLDACYDRHFTETMLWRDTGKAYYSFLALAKDHSQMRIDRPIVSTGKWGCGAFGGTAAHKLLQQAVAATAAGVDLEFSAFGCYDGCDDIAKALSKTRPSVSKAVSLLQCCKDRRTFVNDALQFLQETIPFDSNSRNLCDSSDIYGAV